MTLTYDEGGRAAPDKTSEHSDVVRGQFLELVPDQRIVQRVHFESENSAFQRAMTMTWSLAAVPDGTEVSILGENVPEGIRKEGHDAGLKSTLENLAVYAE